jgi:RNA polymerase II elongation factor ELL
MKKGKNGKAIVMKKAQPPAKLLSPNLQATSSQSTPRVSTPIINETQKRNEAIRFALTHLLAIKPLSLRESITAIRARNSAVLPVLERIAEKESNGDWRLKKRGYRDLDVWGFPYRTVDRDAVVENAIDAFDALRFGPKDPIWQGLLPQEQRFKGITLSKLKLLQPTDVAPKPKVTEKKTAKKFGKDGTDAKKAGKKEAKISADNPSATKAAGDKSTLRDGGAGKTASGTKNGKAVRETDSTKTAKFAQTNPSSSKPKTPSPLSKSPPVNASDFEGHHARKVLPGSPSPAKQPVDRKRPVSKAPRLSSDSEDSRPARKVLPEKQSLKRAADDRNERNESQTSAKKSRLDGHAVAPLVRKPLPADRTSSQPAKRKMDDDDSSSLDSAPLKTRRLLANGSGAVRKVSTAIAPATPDPAARKKLVAKAPSGSSRSGQAPQQQRAAVDSSDSTSPDEALSLRQSMALASKFRSFYKKYEQLYRDISGAAEPPSQERRDELLRMHTRLADMKRMIGGAAGRS